MPSSYSEMFSFCELVPNFFLQCYNVDKVHCVWLSDGEMKVLFERKGLPEPDNLKAAHVQFVRNKEMVTEYLKKTEFIPHIQTVITMEPTAELVLQTDSSQN